jgi:ATP10 protein
MRLLLTLFVCLVSTVFAETLPQIEGENLVGKKIVLPDAAAGHRAILVIGFSHASQGQTKAWADRLDREFSNPAMVTVYPVAVLEAVPRLVRGMASHAIKSGTPKEQFGRFLLVYHKEAELKTAAVFSAPDDAYILLLDASGGIRWHFHGPVTDSAVAELQKEVQAAE